MTFNRVIRKISILLCMILLVGGCKIRFSFNPGTLPSDIQSISIDQFANNAPIIVPTLSQEFTELLRDTYQSQTNLQGVRFNGDLKLTGEIVDYRISPVALTSGNTAANNRLTVTVKVVVECEKHPELSWEDKFSNYLDFPSSQSITDAQGDLLPLINENLSQNIFNKTFSNW